MSNFDFRGIIEAFKEFARKEGFYQKDPIGLLSPVFPDEFNVSAGHDYSFEIFKMPDPLKDKIHFSLIDTCFRRIDIDRVGYSNHLSLFHIALFGYAEDTIKIKDSIRNAVYQFVKFLTEVLGLSLNKLLITTFGEWKEKNINNQDGLELIKGWEKSGISENRLLILNGRRNFFLSQSSICAGPTCEVYYDRGEEAENLGSPPIH
mgnify:CR=1 FL=1